MRKFIKHGLYLATVLVTITINYSADLDQRETEDSSFDINFAACFRELKSVDRQTTEAPSFLQDVTMNKKSQEYKCLRNYINNVTSFTHLRAGGVFTAMMWFWNLYSYYAQYYGKYEMWESKGAKNTALYCNYTQNSTQNATLAGGYPTVSPSANSLSVTAMIFTFNQIIAYNNIVFINKDGYIGNAGAVYPIFMALCLLPLVYAMDSQHLMTTAVYSLFGGLTFILINDGLKYFLGSTTIANPLKQIPSRQFENLIKLLKKLLSAKSWDGLSETDKRERITRYLINELT